MTDQDISTSWLAIRTVVSPDDAERMAMLLFELGANGIEETTDPRGFTTLTAYVHGHNIARNRISDALAAVFPRVVPSFSAIEWDPHDVSWRQHFAPFEIVPGVIVAPSWEHPYIAQGQRVLTLDPGMAFGTGLHSTTRLCARAIHEAVAHRAYDAMLDVGCGSGILSLVAHALGISRIAAIENDAEAATIARENFHVNGASAIHVASDLDQVRARYPLVVANILLNTLIELSPALVSRVETHGRLVLSGITREQGDALTEAFAADMMTVAAYAEEEWLCIIMERKT